MVVVSDLCFKVQHLEMDDLKWSKYESRYSDPQLQVGEN